MRLITLVFTAAAIALPFTVHAQAPARNVIPSLPAPRDPLPRFTITPRGGSLAPVGLPLPQLGLGPPKRVEPGRHRHGQYIYSWPLFYVPELYFPAAPSEAPARQVEQAPERGRLILDVQPSVAEVFSDGYYVGVPEDFSAERGGGILEAGVHRIDIGAPGYQSVTVDLRVAAGQFVTYRAALKALPPPAAVQPTTFYLIPGCYMGNVPPKDAHLPATCDQSRTVSWRP